MNGTEQSRAIALEIERRATLRGISIAALQRQAKVGPTYISDLKKKSGEPRLTKLKAIADKLGCTPNDLLVNQSDSLTTRSPRGLTYITGTLQNDEEPGTAAIEEFDIRGSMGGGSNMDSEGLRPIHTWRMPRELVRAASYATPEQIKIITVVGDSMEGTFRPYEKVMVDTSDKTPSPPGIFVVYDGLGLVVKRVEYVPHSDPPTVRISSDNARYAPYTRTADEAFIQGRVLGRWQWV